jgi:hypothetical protein
MLEVETRASPCRRIRTFRREYAPPKIADSLKWRDFLAFLRANVRLGILGRERFQYWDLLIWTCCRCPSLFSLAVALSIHDCHFRRTCAAQEL